VIDQLARDRIADINRVLWPHGSESLERQIDELTEKIDNLSDNENTFNDAMKALTEKVENNEGGIIHLANRLSKVEAHLLFGDPLANPAPPEGHWECPECGPPEAPESEKKLTVGSWTYELLDDRRTKAQGKRLTWYSKSGWYSRFHQRTEAALDEIARLTALVKDYESSERAGVVGLKDEIVRLRTENAAIKKTTGCVVDKARKLKAENTALVESCASLNDSCDAYEAENERFKKQHDLEAHEFDCAIENRDATIERYEEAVERGATCAWPVSRSYAVCPILKQLSDKDGE